ncbi:MAG: type II secretion system F family protein [Bryobacteraceae bacterium]
MLLFFGVFVLLFLVVLLCVGLGFAFQRSKQNKQIHAMLRTADPAAAERQIKLLTAQGNEDGLTAFLQSFQVVKALDLIAEQAGVEWTGVKLILTSLALVILAALVSSQLPVSSYRVLVVLAVSVAVGAVPFFVVFRKRSKRLAAFEEQFPEALDFISRSMRAGHGFSVGLEMLVLDSPEPLAGSFRRVLNDLHLGSPLDIALGKLTALVPLLDVRFFTASVLLQQETGGNLSEILSKLSHVIRERFQLKGRVKAVAAHGKITGLVLLCMPIAVAFMMLFLSPAYLGMLFTDPTGRKMIGFAIGAQIVGYFCIKKIVNIKV